jgi:ketosteroid isomerase-like protein
MKKLIQNIFIILLTKIIFSCSEKKINPNSCFDIYNLMQHQEDSWNYGNIDDFMSIYWKNDSIVFIGKSGINYGWDKNITNYKNSYKTKEHMGKLKFKNIICNPLNDSTHIVTGVWSLKRNDSIGNINGFYTLLWIKKSNGWKIIYDHTS